MNLPRITLDLSVAEVNMLLDALGAQPYREVYALIETIHAQAGPQLDTGTQTATTSSDDDDPTLP